MNLLTKQQQELNEETNTCLFVKKLENKYVKDKKYLKVRDYTEECSSAADSISNFKYSVPKKIPIAFHNGSNYDYHFIIKKLAGEFEKTIYLFRRKH